KPERTRERRVAVVPRCEIASRGVCDGDAEARRYRRRLGGAELPPPHDPTLQANAALGARRLELEPHELLLGRRECADVHATQADVVGVPDLVVVAPGGPKRGR